MVQHHQLAMAFADIQLRELVLAIPPSAPIPHPSYPPPHVPHLQNQRRLAPVHARLETALVELFPEGGSARGTAFVPLEGFKSDATLGAVNIIESEAVIAKGKCVRR